MSEVPRTWIRRGPSRRAASYGLLQNHSSGLTSNFELQTSNIPNLRSSRAFGNEVFDDPLEVGHCVDGVGGELEGKAVAGFGGNHSTGQSEFLVIQRDRHRRLLADLGLSQRL